MIYVKIEALKPEDGCWEGGNGWQDTDDVATAIAAELRRFDSMWEHMGHGPVMTYKITVAPEESPRRTTRGDMPLPVEWPR